MENRVKLQVGEQQFFTTKDTLMGESAYFSALFSGRWSNQSEDGFYYIDSDPDLFADILRYLRSGNYPLFFNPSVGAYDYAKYSALLGEAQYFGIGKLENWIRNQCYLGAVKTQYKLDILSPDEAQSLRGYSDTIRGDQQLKFSYLPQIKKAYVCPRGIPEHYDNQERCGRRCNNSIGASGVNYEETQDITTVVVRTQRIFDPNVCLGSHTWLEIGTT
ncbi:hypothetical protein F4859DRAFT_492149 [Xylaria cf. heliscus]|nr:hypothetical protein F4859DRAFT_492149 [Xylaria cf. heliscus]